ncbi:MAG: hypothetical protein ACKO7P_10510 [Bacteroidota bacterium]
MKVFLSIVLMLHVTKALSQQEQNIISEPASINTLDMWVTGELDENFWNKVIQSIDKYSNLKNLKIYSFFPQIDQNFVNKISQLPLESLTFDIGVLNDGIDLKPLSSLKGLRELYVEIGTTPETVIGFSDFLYSLEELRTLEITGCTGYENWWRSCVNEYFILDNRISNLSKLEDLSLSGIFSLPKEICEIKSLKFLDIDGDIALTKFFLSNLDRLNIVELSLSHIHFYDEKMDAYKPTKYKDRLMFDPGLLQCLDQENSYTVDYFFDQISKLIFLEDLEISGTFNSKIDVKNFSKLKNIERIEINDLIWRDLKLNLDLNESKEFKENLLLSFVENPQLTSILVGPDELDSELDERFQQKLELSKQIENIKNSMTWAESAYLNQRVEIDSITNLNYQNLVNRNILIGKNPEEIELFIRDLGSIGISYVGYILMDDRFILFDKKDFSVKQERKLVPKELKKLNKLKENGTFFGCQNTMEYIDAISGFGEIKNKNEKLLAEFHTKTNELTLEMERLVQIQDNFNVYDLDYFKR